MSMDGTEREMTLEEWVDKLPETHSARKELSRLTHERDLLARECGAWREAKAEGTLQLDYSPLSGHERREAERRFTKVNAAMNAVDAAGVKVEG